MHFITLSTWLIIYLNYEGLNDRDTESGYKWIDDSRLDYVNWQEGEPNDSRGYENCVEMQTRSGQWNDFPCNFYRPFMCKKNIGENIPVSNMQ